MLNACHAQSTNLLEKLKLSELSQHRPLAVPHVDSQVSHNVFEHLCFATKPRVHACMRVCVYEGVCVIDIFSASFIVMYCCEADSG